jgi:hypothetical protein
MRRRAFASALPVVLVVVLSAAALVIAGSSLAVAQQFPEVPLYALLPSDYPYPLARYPGRHLRHPDLRLSGSPVRVSPV